MRAVEIARKAAIIAGDPVSRIMLLFLAGMPVVGEAVNAAHDNNKAKALDEEDGGGGHGH